MLVGIRKEARAGEDGMIRLSFTADNMCILWHTCKARLGEKYVLHYALCEVYSGLYLASASEWLQLVQI